MSNYLTLTRRALAKHKVSHNQEHPACKCLRSLLNRTESVRLEKPPKIKVGACSSVSGQTPKSFQGPMGAAFLLCILFSGSNQV